MPLQYHPNPGAILVCRYDDDPPVPEMRKRRPVVIITPRLRNRHKLIGVVPLSTTEPAPAEAYHCRIELPHPLPQPFGSPFMWAKCDMFSVVSIDRLDRFRDGRQAIGHKRKFTAGRVSAEQLRDIRAALLHGIGLGNLTKHL